MRALLWIVLAVAGLWSGYWFVGSSAVQRGADQWFEQAAAQGLVAQNAGVRIAGFPNRFDLTITAPRIIDPASGYGWQGGELRLFAMTWKPWHLIALAPTAQVITTPLGEVTIAASDLRGSLMLHPGSDLALSRTVIEAAGLTITTPTGQTSVAQARFATAEDLSRADSHRIGVQVTDLVLDPAALAALPGLPAQVDSLHLDATLLLSAVLDRHAAQTRPEVTGVIVDDAQLDWGPLHLTAKGTLATVSGGFAEGRIALRIENWRLLPAVLGQTGIMDPVLAPTLLRAMEIMAEGTPDPDVLNTVLSFKSGRANFGGLPVGEAPRLAQRQ